MTPPRGTCYLAFDERTAIRETVGEALATTGVISADFAADRQLSILALPHDHPVADTCAEQAADFGLTPGAVSLSQACRVRCGSSHRP
ncbi:MAG: hypothetical protein WAX14_08495 [Rhodococcus sp. (in: high G+C Gram-positive bacteria)]|uniref:hypothetical protein n=1 Tax=Rhodococcus sp. TaxID=1831 RepID=UPI003BB6F1B8